MADEEKNKTVPTQGRNPDQSVGEEGVEKEEDVFDPNSDTCKTCGGCEVEE